MLDYLKVKQVFADKLANDADGIGVTPDDWQIDAMRELGEYDEAKAMARRDTENAETCFAAMARETAREPDSRPMTTSMPRCAMPAIPNCRTCPAKTGSTHGKRLLKRP